MYLDVQELTKRISKYIWNSNSCSNKYPNIFELPTVDWTNIQIYLDVEKFTKQISKYMGVEEKPGLWTQIIYAGNFIKIIDH